jgi:hypothetical protein
MILRMAPVFPVAVVIMGLSCRIRASGRLMTIFRLAAPINGIIGRRMKFLKFVPANGTFPK